MTQKASCINRTVILGCRKSGLGLLRNIIDCSKDTNVHYPSLLSWYLDYAYGIADSPELLELFHHQESVSFPVLAHLIPIATNHKEDILDRFHFLSNNFPGTKFVWIIRNPIESACSISANCNITIQNALEYWYVCNVCLWYFFQSLSEIQKCVIKYENLFLSNRSLKSLFNLLECDFSPQFLNYGDFDHAKQDETGFLDHEQVEKYSKIEILGLNKMWSKYKHMDIVRMFEYSEANKD